MTSVGLEESSEDDEIEAVLPLTQPAEDNTESEEEGNDGSAEQEDSRQTAPDVEDNGKTNGVTRRLQRRGG